VLNMTDCWICSTSLLFKIFSPIDSFSKQKFVLSALPIWFPPNSVIPQLNNSNSMRDKWLEIRSDIAYAPTFDKLEFLNFKERSYLLVVLRMLQIFKTQFPSILQSAKFIVWIWVLDLKISSKSLKFSLPMSFSDKSMCLILSV